MTIPAGMTAAYRRSLGTSRGVSAYVSPMYRWVRVDSDDTGSASDGNVRVALGVDFSFNPSLGLTAGTELGSRDTGRQRKRAARSGPCRQRARARLT